MLPEPDYYNLSEDELIDVYDNIDRVTFAERFNTVQQCLNEIAVQHYKDLRREDAIKKYFEANNYQPASTGGWVSSDEGYDSSGGGDGGGGDGGGGD